MNEAANATEATSNLEAKEGQSDQSGNVQQVIYVSYEPAEEEDSAKSAPDSIPVDLTSLASTIQVFFYNKLEVLDPVFTRGHFSTIWGIFTQSLLDPGK